MKPAFRGGPVHVRTPATSANLGPGYDAFGLALAWHDDVIARVVDAGLHIDVAGEGEALVRDETHLVVRAMRATFERLGGQPPGLELSCANRIPHGRGLGSSAAAIVAGVLLARALTVGGDERLPADAAFALAAELEGHPDNIAACYYGGLTIAWTDQGTARAARTDVRRRHPAGGPGATVRIVNSRGPRTVARSRAARRCRVHRRPQRAAGRRARAAAVTSPDALFAATEDRLHQPYRAAAAPQTAALVGRTSRDRVGRGRFRRRADRPGTG